MAGTVTVTESLGVAGIRKVQFDWLSDSNGDATATTTNKYTGRVIWAVFEPDSGDTQPTSAYDVTVVDGDSYDVLNANGADLSNAANVYKSKEDKLGAVYDSTLSLIVANAGDAKGGQVTLLTQ